MKMPEDAREGEWDFSGACAPPEDAPGRTAFPGQHMFSLGCFRWIRRGKSSRLKKGPVEFRIRGLSHDPAPSYAAARAFCNDRNRITFHVPGEPMEGFWTDYPILELGDIAGQPAPVRPCTLLDYDNDKYVTILVDGVRTSIKAGYVYTREGRKGQTPAVPTVDAATLRALSLRPSQVMP